MSAVLGRHSNEIVNAAIARPATLTTPEGIVLDVIVWEPRVALNEAVKISIEAIVREESVRK